MVSTTTRSEPSLASSGPNLRDVADEHLRAILRELPWEAIRRRKQTPPPGDWFAWLILAGRGFGKTRTGAEFIKEALTTHSGWRAALVAATFPDGRDTMVEGESGLLACLAPEDLRGGSVDTAWNRSIGELFLANGSKARIYTSEKPRQLRGPQHHVAWGDEPAHWYDAKDGDEEGTTWSNLKLGLRLGRKPRAVLTTTPKPVKLLVGTHEKRGLIADPTVVVTRGSTYENLENLAPTFREQVLSAYEGTRIGRQELHAELLTDVEVALWTLAMLDHRKPPMVPAKDGWVPDMLRVVVAIDPAVTNNEGSDETGIIVAGLGHDGRGYVLADRSTKASPNDWARRAIAAYDEFGADRVVAEVNNGGDLVESVLRTVRPTIPYRAVHASKGKRTRAEPVSALYEQKRVSHVDTFAVLEDQLTTWEPEAGDSPDRLDALVWALTDLMLAQSTSGDFSLVA
jgi:predicted phage terminase large subunit-like protein